jgi:hypothetical protein
MKSIYTTQITPFISKNNQASTLMANNNSIQLFWEEASGDYSIKSTPNTVDMIEYIKASYFGNMLNIAVNNAVEAEILVAESMQFPMLLNFLPDAISFSQIFNAGSEEEDVDIDVDSDDEYDFEQDIEDDDSDWLDDDEDFDDEDWEEDEDWDEDDDEDWGDEDLEDEDIEEEDSEFDE